MDVVDASDFHFATFFFFRFLQNRANRFFLEQAADFALETRPFDVFEGGRGGGGGGAGLGFFFANAAVAQALRDCRSGIKFSDQFADSLVAAQSTNDVIRQRFDSLNFCLI